MIRSKITGGVPLGIPLILLIVTVIALNFVEGLDGHLLPVSLTAIGSDWGAPLSDFGLPMAAGYAGGALGAPIGGFLGDRFGRKRTCVAGAILFAATTLVVPLCWTTEQLVAARLLAGLGIGGCFPPTLALLTECVPPRLKGITLSLALVFQSLGIASTGLLAGLTIPSYGWTTLFYFSGSLSVLATLAAILFLPESPSFLMRRERTRQRASEIVSRYGIAAEDNAPRKNAEAAPPLASWSLAAFMRSARLFLSMFLTYLVISIALSWMPSFLQTKGFDVLVSTTTTTVWITSAMGGTLLGGIGVTRFGAKGAAIAFMALAIASLLATAGLLTSLDAHGGASLATFYILLCLCGAFMSAQITCYFSHATDVFSPDIRASGIGVLHMFGKGGGFLGAWVGVATLRFEGAGSFFVLLASVVLLMILILSSDSVLRLGNRIGLRSDSDPSSAT